MTWGRETISPARLREVLERHRGAGRTILSRDLAVMLGLQERDGRSIRESVNELIDLGYPIGSSTRDGGGYFWIVSEEELQMCCRNYLSRARELERRVGRLIEAFRRGPKQAALIP